MEVRWTASARQDRLEIRNYIAEENRSAALRLDLLFSAAAARLATYPNLGRPGTVAGTRELILHESYRMIYEIRGDTVWVLTLVHTARAWPPPRPDLDPGD